MLFQRAEKEDLLPTVEQVMTAINEQKRQSGMNDEESSRNLEGQNVRFDELREETKKDLAIKALQDK